MSGLFSRLAQQQIHQRATSIKPAQEPVFPVEIYEKKARVNGDDQDSMLASRNSETETKYKNANAVMSHDSDSPIINNRVKNEAEDTEQKIKPSIIPTLTPVINSSINVTIPHKVEIPIANESQIKPEVGATIETLLPEKSHAQQIPFNSNNDEEVPLAKIEESGLWPDNNSIIKPVNNNHREVSQSIHNKNVRVTQQFSQHVHDENQTTINVSIGQIDIRATHVEKENKKTTVSSPNRNRSNALEEYQKKRARGER